MKTERENYLRRLIIILDTGTLGLVTNPYHSPVSLECKNWFKKILLNTIKVTTSEVCDYELRRELIRSNKKESLKRLELIRKENLKS